MLRHLTEADYNTMPWANGLGRTVELIRVDQGDDMLWRLSIASVTGDGPFSVFPGVERNLTVLSGPGFRLRGRGVVFEAALLAPVAFAGDVPLQAEGVSGPSVDFNVMTARALPRPEVWVVPADTQVGPGGVLCLLALKAGPGIAAQDLLITDSPISLPVPALAVRLAVPFPQ